MNIDPDSRPKVLKSAVHECPKTYIGHPEYVRSRISHTLERFRGALFRESLPVENLQVVGPVGRISFEDAKASPFEACRLGFEMAPPFSTYWFRLEFKIPESWKGHEFGLYWNSHSEAGIWTEDGHFVQGLNPGRHYADLSKLKDSPPTQTLYLEVACNRLLGQSDCPGRPFEPSSRTPYWLENCELRQFDREAWDLFHDLRVLTELEADSIPDATTQAVGNNFAMHRPALETAWAGKLRFDLNRVCNVLDLNDRSTWATAKEILHGLLSQTNGSYTHQLSAIGHAHIDTAWLWPVAETYRKTLRTFGSSLRYMEDYPEFKFAVSQAYQYEQIENRNPELFSRICSKVKSGQWIPVGGTYIEPDCNLPSGESLCRQFLIGQRYFESRFGQRCREFWNPDVFGYNGQLPQIMKHAGIEFFLTQKLSWNRFTSPDHHTFHWQALDGTSVLTHFPPSDTYNGTASIQELRYQAANQKDPDRSNMGLYPFGFGDGGGGPTPQMLESLKRTQDLLGVPKCKIQNPIEFFEELQTNSKSTPVVRGELYFELHRGTYTSQAEMKRGLRDSEKILHNIEFLGATAQYFVQAEYLFSEVESLWKLNLLNQFHDILPGTSIAEAHQVARDEFDLVRQVGSTIIELLMTKLAVGTPENESAGFQFLNSIGVPRIDVVEAGTEQCGTPELQVIASPSYGVGNVIAAPSTPVTCELVKDRFVLDNGFLVAEISTSGSLSSLKLVETDTELLSSPGNLLKLHDDHNSLWDAWDVEPSIIETGRECRPAYSAKIIRNSSLRVEIEFERKIGQQSCLKQTVRLDAESEFLEFHTEVDWQEKHKLLRVEFPTEVNSDRAAFETAFGTVERTTHMNTAADKARFETPGHRWADLSEGSFGLTLLTDYKHGFSSLGNVLGLSLLRAPTYPDPNCDEGVHRFKYALRPHLGPWHNSDPLRHALRFNYPLVQLPPASILPNGSLVEIQGSTLICDTVKPAEDGNGIVLRLFEPYGASGSAVLRTKFRHANACISNILEETVEEISMKQNNDQCEVTIRHRAFEIVTIRLFDSPKTAG